MICKPCRAGGAFAADLDYAPPAGSDLGNILELHDECEYPVSCPCQHKAEVSRA